MPDSGFRAVECGPEDLGEVLSFLRTSLYGMPPPPAGFVDLVRREVRARSASVVALYDRIGIAGAATVRYRPSLSGAALFASVEDLCVRPDVRNRGLGRALLSEVERLCVARGISYVEVQTEEAGFYRSCGFEVEQGVLVLSRGLPALSQNSSTS